MPAEYNPTDIAEQAARQAVDAERERLEAEIAADDFRWLMRDKRGRRFVFRMLGICGVFQSSFRLNNEMAFLEGRRDVGLRLLSMVATLCPEQHLLMLQEQQERTERDGRAGSKRSG